MRKLIFIFQFFLLLFFKNSIAQFSEPIRLTNGNNDRNPSFANILSSTQYYTGFEFMVFERVSGNHSNICIAKIGPMGPVDSAVYLTNDSSLNTNPRIIYNKPSYPNNGTMKNAVVVWQSNKFGRESIFGSNFDTVNGWSAPFIIDSSNADNRKPSFTGVESPYYAFTYESGDDIKYKKFNILTLETVIEKNLTLYESEVCSNPMITGSVYITYEKEFSPTHRAIYFRAGTSDSISLTGHPGDTIAYAGINRSIRFGKQSLLQKFIYQSNRNTNVNIYAADISLSPQSYPVLKDTHDNLDYAGFDVDITKYLDLQNNTYSYITRDQGSLRFNLNINNPNLRISEDPLYPAVIDVNNGLRAFELNCLKYWFVYNKDSSDLNYPSTIYGIRYTLCYTDAGQNNSFTPVDFSLSQNYPNPFNPVTHLKFGIPNAGFVSLKVFDALGKEVAALVNEVRPPGYYTQEFDGRNLASGIYLYRLQAGSFLQTKRMLLIK